ncbi:hypothetical protein WBG06_08680, partial [Nocardioides sp. CCNWLW239]|uniref:hypothetical protein n=1 Tax=Nocardioides sp. CCNWLW239 TaxID=3128902 RepID=UPI00301962B8
MNTRARRAPAILIASLALLLATGFVLGTQVSGFLGISAEPVTAAPETATVAAARTATTPTVGRVRLSGEGEPTPQVRLAAAAFQQALDDSGTEADGTLTVTTGSDLGEGSGAEAYRATSVGTDIRLEAADAAGAATGLYRLADRVRTARPLLDPAEDGEVQQPDLPLRLVDKGAAGVPGTAADWRTGEEYSHNSGQFADAILSDAPFVDTEALAEDAEQFRTYVDHQLARGYNGIVMPGFLEYVTFDRFGDGREIYPDADGPHVGRARAMREHFGPMWKYAHDAGMKVYLLTDMLALSTPLQGYLDEHGLSAEDPALWEIYAAGLEELFAEMPYVDGLMIRIGEGGEIYQLPGWDYRSEIAVTTPTGVKAMLDAFTSVAEKLDREIIFRTWSVGVGAVGDLHTNPASYEEVLGEVHSDALIVSTKHVAGDFYSFLPLNPTLETGGHRRIVEMQSRREFEGFGALPNDLAPAYSAALTRLTEANPNIEGVWSWSQDGGPIHAGPRTLYLREGFWQLWDLNAYAASRLAWDTSADPGEITADWARETFSSDPATVRAIGEAMALSRDAVLDGLYIEPFAENQVRALGLEIPPQTWLFEWDIVTGDTAVLNSIYAISKDRLDDAVEGGQQAIETAESMRRLVAETDPTTWRDPALREQLLVSIDYEINLFRVLGDYRAMTMYHAEWLDTGSSRARDRWQSARADFEKSRASHVARYGEDQAHPAFQFTAADIGAQRADRDPAMAWLARGLLVLALAGLLLVRPLRIAVTRPWRLGPVLREAPPRRWERVAVLVVPPVVLVLGRATLTWFAAPSHLVVTVGAWVLFALTLRLLIGRRDAFALWAVVGGVVLVRSVILMIALAGRGPGRYWYLFWTEPGSRTFYITVAFAGFGLLFVLPAVALRSAYGFTRRGAVGRVLIAAGIPVLIGGVGVALMGTERALTVWNDQMALIPWGLSRILGITVHLGIPTSLPWYAAGCGAAVALVGVVGGVRGPKSPITAGHRAVAPRQTPRGPA